MLAVACWCGGWQAATWKAERDQREAIRKAEKDARKSIEEIEAKIVEALGGQSPVGQAIPVPSFSGGGSLADAISDPSPTEPKPNKSSSSSP